jgi:transposase-like protein
MKSKTVPSRSTVGVSSNTLKDLVQAAAVTARSKEAGDSVLRFAPQQAFTAQLETWMQGLRESNEALVAALQRMRASYCALLAGKPIRDEDEVLALVASALTRVENKPRTFSRPRRVPSGPA